MKIYKLLIVIFLLSGFLGNKVVAQQLDFELRYNDAAAIYEVYATPDASNARYFVGGGSQLSILLPQDIDDVPLQINTVAGGLWTDNSRIFAPASDHIHDFHGVASNGALVNFVAGEPLLLFTFELPNGECRGDVRLFENAADGNSSAAGMNGSDFRNFFANVFKPSENNWLKNENVINATCAHAPSVAPNSLTTQENIPATICMLINDPNVGDVFEATLCANVSTSSNSVSNVSIAGNEICLEYTPSAGFVGAESVCIEVCDDSGLCNTSRVSVLVEPEPVYFSLSATSDQCQNTIDWTIFNPSEFEYFELERSEDNLSYESLGLYESNGETEEVAFNHVDTPVQDGYFYRLKLVFINGDINHTEAIFVNTICEEELFVSQASVTAVADACENTIDWTISNHIAGSYYELERSVDGTTFELLQKNEAGVGSSTLAFHYTDNDTKGDHNYRIKTNYADGREAYSENVFVTSNCDVQDGISLYPNPISQSQPILTLKFNAETKSAKIIVTDALGRVVRRLDLEVELGMNTYQMDVVDLAVGTYFIVIEGKEDITKSFVKMDERF